MTRLILAVLALSAASALGAQSPARPEPIRDNSFLIEEAYNQPGGVVQHISTFAHPRTGRDWTYSFTQEWPVGNIRHQLSASVPVLQVHDGTQTRRGLGDVALNYRYQLRGAEGGPLAVAPRLSLLLPTGSATNGFGAGAAGVQVNLPVSVELSESVVSHSNAGATFVPSARDAVGNSAAVSGFNLGQSVIWLATPTLNLMLEGVWTNSATVIGAGRTERVTTAFVSPGVRWAHNLANGLQVVPGFAFPIGVGPSRSDNSLFAYLSFEHPF